MSSLGFDEFQACLGFPRGEKVLLKLQSAHKNKLGQLR